MHRPQIPRDALSRGSKRQRLLTKIAALRASTRMHVRRVEASRAQIEVGLTSTMRGSEKPPASSAETRDVDIRGFGAGSKCAL
jgi:hypothetical protein